MATKPRDPEVIDADTIRLWGGGPSCPGCDGPTYSVAPGGERPWWCPDCEVRLDGDGEYGAAAHFPAGSQP